MAMASASSSLDVRRSDSRPRFRYALPIFLILLLLDTAYLFIANRASGPPRVELAAFTYEGTLLLHLMLGILGIGFFLVRARALMQALKEQKGPAATAGALAGLSLAVCLLSGLAFIGVGAAWLPLGLRPLLLLTHDVSTGLLLLFSFAYVLLRARGKNANEHAKNQSVAVARLALAIGVPFVGLLAYTLYAPNTDRVIANPALPPMVPDDEGDGKAGKFFPASAQSVGGQFFPSAYFMDSKSCGVKGCHPDIYAQWNSSAHHFSSFNNQWYRKAIEYFQEVAGTKPSKWCAGCHDMAVLLTEDPKHPGKSRFDVPIVEHEYPAEKYPESHAGIGCAVCHSIVHVKSTMGNSDYLADYPPMHKYLDTNNPTMHAMHTFLTRLAPEPHKKTFLRPFHRDQTAKFCSSCHKVHLDIPTNNYRWFRGFNDYDAWQQSGVSGFGAASFYYPSDDKTGQPAFKKCADCHMPNTPSQDAGNLNGIVHNHRFPAANTALPTANHDTEQLAIIQKFLQDKAVSIDIFALRRDKGGSVKNMPVKTLPTKAARPDTPKAANLMGESSEAAVPTAAASVPLREETLTAPLNRGGEGAMLVRGESPLIDVVVRTLKMGHSFPGGTTDAQEVWVELEAKDDKGKTFYHSGKLQWPAGPLEEGAERYRALLVDGHSHPINKRNAWSARAVVYAKTIPPGAADAVHFRLRIPKECGDKVTLTARLNYRKFTWWNNAFAYLGRSLQDKSQMLTAASKEGEFHAQSALGYDTGKNRTSGPVSHGWDDRPMHFDADIAVNSGKVKNMPVLPITVMAENSITLPVVNPGQKPPNPAATLTEDDKKKDRIRWNDYGIGFLLQGDFRHATNAFEQVTKIAPKWPEGWVNIGRVRQAERDSKAAQAAFEKAFPLYDSAPTPMTKYQLARTRNFYAQTLFDQGRLEDSLNTLAQVREVFPDDRNVCNLTGTILFRLGRYDEAIAQLEHTLTIDPEDIVAHYNLMKSYRGKGDADSVKLASEHERLYKRFKADETTTNLIGPYLREHPADNNLVSRIHEHGDAIIGPMPAWVKERQPQVANHKKPTMVSTKE